MDQNFENGSPTVYLEELYIDTQLYSLEEDNISSDSLLNINFNNGNTNNNNYNNNNYVLGVQAFSEQFTLQELYDAYFECRRHKRWKFDSLRFELNFKEEIYKLWCEINSKTYEIGKNICFVIFKPKVREIFAANFRDRIVHHLIIRNLKPLFEKYFIDSSYSCREGKGTLYGENDLYNKIYKASKHYTKDCYIGKFDLQSFFMSINKNILWNKIYNFVNTYYTNSNKNLLLWIIDKIIFNCPQKNCIIINRKNWKYLPKYKSLFYNSENRGLPIGNLTSQWFANFYLTEFDKQVKFTYCRYVDDFVILFYNRHQYKTFFRTSKQTLKNLDLTINSNKIYVQHYSKGVKFLSCVLKNGRKYITNRILGNFISKINCNNLQAINSYLGILKHYNSYNRYIKIKNQFKNKNLIFNNYKVKKIDDIYYADEGKVFKRIYDGFNPIEPPTGEYYSLKLGQILVDSEGNPLQEPIPDLITYYEETDVETDQDSSTTNN